MFETAITQSAALALFEDPVAHLGRTSPTLQLDEAPFLESLLLFLRIAPGVPVPPGNYPSLGLHLGFMAGQMTLRYSV